MYLLAILIAVGILLLGANFSMTLVGGPPWSKKAEFSPISIGGKTLSVEKISIGVTLLILGTLWLATWFYFLFQGWQSFAAQINWLMLHVVLQFLTSVGLLVSGASILRQWKGWGRIYVTSISILVGGIGIAMYVYGPRGHGNPVFMIVFAILTFIIGGVLTLALYSLGQIRHDVGSARGTI